MKQTIYVLTFLTITQLCYGQDKSFYIPTNDYGDTTLWFKWQQEKFEKAGLKNLAKTTYIFHFRFASETQAIELWTTDNLNFSGTLTNFTTSYNPNINKIKEENIDKFYSNSQPLDSGTAKQIYELLKEKSIFEIPPQDSIKGWTDGFDGKTYFIEYSTKNSYTFKSYWTPSIFKDEIDEAKRFHELIEQLEKLLNLRQTFGTFINSLPFGTYRAGGMMVITPSKKGENKRKTKKPNR